MLRICLAAVYAIVLLVVGALILVYSPWAQETARRAIVAKMSTDSLSVSIDALRLRFPLRLSGEGIALVSSGDTIVAARNIDVDASLLPLLAGRARINEAVIIDARYRSGAPDSAMMMTIAADSLAIGPASVTLSDMDISIDDGSIRGGNFALKLKPDTTASTPSEPVNMKIKLGKLRLDRFAFEMQMLPTIDTLSAAIASSELRDGMIDLLNQKISLGRFGGRGLDARYIAPDSATAALAVAPPVAQSDTASASAPWTVTIDSLKFTDSKALYTTAGVCPLPGLDFGYIAVDSLDIAVTDFYNQAAIVRVPLKMRGTERCGVALSIDGTLDIDSTSMAIRSATLRTDAGTGLTFDYLMGMGDMAADPTLPLMLKLDGALAPSDLGKMFPAFSPYFAGIPSADDILLTINADGTTGRLGIDDATLKLNRCLTLNADGFVENFMNPSQIGGDIALKGNIVNVDGFKRALLDPSTARSFNIPPMTLDGRVALRSGVVDGKLAARTGAGSLRLKALWNSRGESYDASLTAASFPLNAFMPLMGVGQVSASIDAKGRGYNPFKSSTTASARLNIGSVAYQHTTYRDITGTATLADGQASLDLNSSDTNADFTLKAKGNLSGDTYRWTADLDGRNINLYALSLSNEPSSIEAVINADATIGPGKNDMEVSMKLSDLFYRQASGTIALTDVDAHLNAADSLTEVKVTNRDFVADFSSPRSLTSLADAFSLTSAVAAAQIGRYSIDADSLQQALPPFALDIVGGRSNLVNDILAPSKMSVRRFRLSADNDTTLNVNAFADRFDTGSMRLDSIYFGLRSHGAHVHIDAGVENRPGNLDEWHNVSAKGVVDGNKISLRLNQKNVKGLTGFDIGLAAEANAADTTVTLHIKPYEPVIGYRQWTANDDNFISYTIPSRHIDANLRMTGGNSSLAIYTDETEGHDNHGHQQEDLVVRLSDIHISDWIAVNPFAPPVKGDIDADMRLNMHDGIITGKGSAGISNFIYGRDPVADFRAEFDIAATAGGTVRANADVLVNGVKTMSLTGALNDSTSTSPLALDFSMIRFPLATANPFLPAGVAKLSGMLNGSLKISGTDSAPVFNGTLDFDSTAVRLGLTGTAYSFSDTPITVSDNLVLFKDFTISGCNDNPLKVNGNVDIANLDNMKVNLALKADNMMIVDTKRASRGADVFGKAYISLDANAHGSMQFMNVNADLSINSGTNVTYIIPDATSNLANKSVDDMVKFVNFTDSAAVVAADSLQRSGMAMMLDATLTVQDGTILNVDLSTDGKNRVQLQSNGTLTYAMTPLDDGRLTGRLNIDKGFVRYTPPFMSEKLFNFENGSYVAFNGNMMNPTLNIKAVDVVKANVTQEGQNSRLVNFDVSLNVGGTLDRMDVKFDLSTDDDITVANELESMSAEQRANQAMNMLLYNVYTGPGTKANASLSGNPLFSFLESQINSWAANNIKGVDISFGIDQYDRTVNGSTSQTMSYSYQVSKSLFNDRFKIVVGGNYSTDANADENFSQNLINDISFEYFLNDARTMYVRLFRHTGYESILEGEITQTGAGFVYRRKLRRLGDMFLPPKVVEQRLKRQQEMIENKEVKQANSDDNEND